MGNGPWLLGNHKSLVLKTHFVVNIKLGVVTQGTVDESFPFLAFLATKPFKEQSINLISFDKFSPSQKLLRVTVYVLRFIPSHENYRIVDVSVTDHVELDETEHHFQYFVQKSPLVPKESNFLTKIASRKAASLLSLRFLGLTVSFVLLVDSDG